MDSGCGETQSIFDLVPYREHRAWSRTDHSVSYAGTHVACGVGDVTSTHHDQVGPARFRAKSSIRSSGSPESTTDSGLQNVLGLQGKQVIELVHREVNKAASVAVPAGVFRQNME